MQETTAERAAKIQKTNGAKSATEPVISVWLVEDNHTFRNTVARVLEQIPALECSRHFSNSEDALAALVDGSPSYDGNEETWRDRVAYCSMMSSALSDRERTFINDMLAWRGEPTPKQSSWLDAIHARLKLRTAA